MARRLVRRPGSLRADFLKIGHHGSRTSTTPPFLAAVRPSIAAISAGVRNRFGHSGRTDDTGSNNWDGGSYPNLNKINTTTGWAPSCTCGARNVPCTVLDPFSGAGTTALVADRMGRNAIGIELNPAYNAMARSRVVGDCPLFAEVAD